MTREEIKQERHRLLGLQHDLEVKHRREIKILDKELRKLEEACQHPPEAAGSGSYSSWCNDCGWSRDTT